MSDGWTVTWSPVATNPSTVEKSGGLICTHGVNPAARQAETMRPNQGESGGSSVTQSSSARSRSCTLSRAASG